MTLTLNEILTNGGIGLAILLTAIQIAPIKVNPWTYLFAKIGDAINFNLRNNIQQIQEDMIQTQHEIQLLKAEQEKQVALQHRNHILAFSDALYNSKRPNKEYFEQILREMTEYNLYSKTHPEFENECITTSQEFIKQEYQTRLNNHSF